VLCPSDKQGKLKVSIFSTVFLPEGILNFLNGQRFSCVLKPFKKYPFPCPMILLDENSNDKGSDYNSSYKENKNNHVNSSNNDASLSMNAIKKEPSTNMNKSKSEC
jgi:hypothetical protein